MSINKFRPHVLVLPEDTANAQLANGFKDNLNINPYRIQILSPAGGWENVLNIFEKNLIPDTRNYRDRRIVLLLDFDSDEERLNIVKEKIPDDIKERVFVIGVFSEPENLRRVMGKSYEAIGIQLAQECFERNMSLWRQELLQHNALELQRIAGDINSFLFVQP